MAILEGPTRKRITELELLIKEWQMERADSLFRNLVLELPKDSLTLISPELRELVRGFQKKRRKELGELLERALAGDLLRVAQPPETAVAKDESQVEGRYSSRLDDLRDKHIFQWATYYRDNLTYIFRDMLERLRDQQYWEGETDDVGLSFEKHSRDIFQRGFAFSVDRGFSSDVAVAKSSGGLQRFVYLIMTLMIEEAASIRNARVARLAWDIVSRMICGILKGYGQSSLGEASGWELLRDADRIWLPALGFVRAAHAKEFLEDFPDDNRPGSIYITVVPMLVAMERLANRFHGFDFVYPRLSRVTLGYPPRLDVSLVVNEGGAARDLLVSAFYDEEMSSKRPIEDAIALRAAVVVTRLSRPLRTWAETLHPQIVDASGVRATGDDVEDFSEVVASRLESRAIATAAALDKETIARNFAAEFPLDDPDYRQLFTVERYSVKTLLNSLRRGTGIHLWCSVRRSGKTTAALNLTGIADGSQVVFQTMDHQPTQVELNLLEQRVREALTRGLPISGDFFQNIVDECLLMSAPAGGDRRKCVLVLDEYESLFGLIAAMTDKDQGLRFTVAQPLLSQMVGFASRNLLIFMGQRPDAHFILSAQNQLSPLVKQHNFPLFEHIAGSGTSEFAQFLKRVLTDGLPFSYAFANAVYQETRGHPYLTVNLMVDFCDWLIKTNAKMDQQELDADQFKAFERDNLSPAALQRSPHYSFFMGMLSEFLSEKSRANEPWLFAVTSVLQEMGKKKASISASGFQKMALPFCTDVSVSPDRLMVSAAMSNFVRITEGQVSAGIPLMVRLASAALPRIN